MQKLTIPGTFPAEYLLICQENGIDIKSILEDLGLNPNLDKIRSMAMPFPIMQQMMETLWKKSNHHLLMGMYAGLRISITNFGAFGQGFLSCENFAQALEFTTQYWDVIGRGVTAETIFDADNVYIDFKIAQSCPDFLSQWMVESGIFSCWRAMSSVLPQYQNQIQVYLSFEPHELPIYLQPNQFHFNTGVNRISFPQHLLRQPLPFYSPSGFLQAKLLCDQQLELLNTTLSMAQKVLAQFKQQQYVYPDLNTMADMLALSSRTLRRKLSEENTNYSSILHKVKQQDAIHLLQQTDLTVDKISSILGYEDDANFCKAFKKWTKMTPSQFRNRI